MANITLSLAQFVASGSVTSVNEQDTLIIKMPVDNGTVSPDDLKSLKDEFSAEGTLVIGANLKLSVDGLIVENDENDEIYGGVFAAFNANKLPGIPTLTSQINALMDDSTETTEATVASIAGLSAALTALSGVVDQNDADIMAIIGEPADGQEPATGLYATIAEAVATAVSDLEGQINALMDDSTETTEATVASIAGLSAALTALSGVVDQNDDAIMAIIGEPADGQEPATGLYATIAEAVATAVSDLEGQIEAVAANVETNADGIAANVTAISDLQDALDALSSLVGTTSVSSQISAVVGAPASGEGESAVQATGLYLAIDNAIASAVAGIEADIAKLVNDAVEGQAPSTKSIAGLKAALESLASVVGNTNSGLVMKLASLETQVTELGSALSAGYNTAKLAYDAAVDAAAASKGLADTAKAAYETARDAVANASNKATAAATAVEKANDFYAKAITAKTDADNLVAKANTVTIAAAQTPSSADDGALVDTSSVTVAQAAATAQTAAANAVIVANSNVNAATIVLSNATLDASNQVIVTFIDYSSAAAATTSDISAAQTAQNVYEAALTTFTNTPDVNNANALETAATNFNTAAVKAANTAQAALDKATASDTAANTTTSTADNAIAETNVATATTAKNTADGLAETAAANLAFATAKANVPVVQALAGVGNFERGFSVTADAVVTVTVTTGTTTVTAGLEQTFTKTTTNGVDTYTAKTGMFTGAENTIAVSAVMVDVNNVSSVAATIADLDIDTTAPVKPTITTIENDNVVNATEAADGIQVTGTAEAGSTVSVYMGGTTKTATAGNDGAYSVTFSGTEVPVDGSYGVDVKATDAAGNESTLTSPNITIDTDADIGNNLSITIATDNEVTNAAEVGTVAFTLAGIDSDAASVAVTFADSVTPTAGTVTVNATKSGTTWTVGTADLTGLKDGAVTATVTVTDIAGNTATATDTLALATTAAKVNSVALTAENEATFAQLNAGDVVTATVTMDSAVTVTGAPTLTLVIGNDEVQATYDAANSTTTALKFNYTIEAGQTDIDGISIKANGIVLPAATETLPAATITDANGNPATLTFTAVTDNTSYKVDNTAPAAVAAITAISADTEASGATNGTDFNTKTAEQTVSGTYNAELVTGEKIQVSVNDTTWVDVTVTPDSTPANGGTWTTAANVITLVAGENTLFVRTIDAAGNVKAGSATQTVTLDQTPPTVTVYGIDISVDTGVSATDFNTKEASQTITATLSTALGSGDGETLWGSVDGGSTWTNVTTSVSTTDNVTTVSWSSTLIAKTESNTPEIQFQVRDDAGNAGETATKAYVLDALAPTATVTLASVMDDVGGIQDDIFDANDRAAATDDTSLTLSGAVSAALGEGEAVVIYDTQSGVATRLGTATINQDGTGWTFTESREVTTTVLQDSYTANYSAVVEDLAGNQSTSTGNTFAATISTTAPTTTATIVSVTDSIGIITGLLTTGGVTDDTELVLAGTLSTGLNSGEVLAVYDGITRLGEAMVTNTDWTYTDSTLANGNKVSYTVVVENIAVGIQGTLSTAFTTTIDTLAPSVPTIALAEDTGTLNSDWVTSNGQVNVTFAEGGGTWQYTLDSTADTPIWVTGTDTSVTLTTSATSFAVRQIDAAGNVGTASAGQLITFDNLAPTAPTGVTLTAVGGTVKGNTLNTTNTNLTAVANITADEATGGKAELYIGDKLVATDSSIAADDNSVAFSVGTENNTALQAAIAAGGIATVKLYDAAGNVITSAVENPTLTVDYMPPETPTVSLAHDTGITGDNTDLYTKDATLTISALESGATRSYTVDGGSASGTYTAPTTQGSHTVTVTDTDAAGNVSIAGSITFTLDTEVNAPTITGLTNDTGASNIDKTTRDMTLSFGSSVETGALVEYSINNGSTWLSQTDYLALADGTYSVVVRQTDKAGNVSQASGALEGITKDTTKTAIPSLTFTDNGTSTTDGITNNATVSVSLASDVNTWQYSLDGATNWNNGVGNTFSLGEITKTFAIGDIKVRAFDLAGNESDVASNTKAYTLDLTPPAANTTIGTNGVSYINGTGLSADNHFEFGDTIRLNFTEKLSAITSITVTDSNEVTHSTGLNVFANQTGTTYAQVTLQDDGSGGPFIQAGDVVTIVGVDFVGNSATMTFMMA